MTNYTILVLHLVTFLKKLWSFFRKISSNLKRLRPRIEIVFNFHEESKIVLTKR